MNDGQIIVNTSDDKKVELILNGVDLTCSDSSAVYVISSPKKTVLTLAEGSVNLIQDGSTYAEVSTDDESDVPNAAIYSKDDLVIEGSGIV